MENKQYIAVVGRCPKTAEDLTSLVQPIAETFPDGEINFFDLPSKEGLDSGGFIGKVFIHRYAEGNRGREVARDIIALGPHKVYILGKQDEFVKNIKKAMLTYGIVVIES